MQMLLVLREMGERSGIRLALVFCLILAIDL